MQAVHGRPETDNGASPWQDTHRTIADGLVIVEDGGGRESAALRAP